MEMNYLKAFSIDIYILFIKIYFNMFNFFQRSFRFRAKLRGRYRVPIYTLFPPCTAFPVTNIPHQNERFVTIEPTLAHPNPPEFIVYIMVYSW